MSTIVWFGALGLSIAAAAGVWWLRSTGATAAVPIGPKVEVVGATSEQLEMARWAIGRFETAGLEPPPVEIEFHGAPSGCGGHRGFARGGAVDVCNSLVNAMARRTLLHEMSHVWLDQEVDDATAAKFLALRGLPSWNDSHVPWRLRGYEQGRRDHRGLSGSGSSRHRSHTSLQRIWTARSTCSPGSMPRRRKRSPGARPQNGRVG